ncbi:hypothetical protein FB446DRAFT_409569 [Lentinula raphanica]|nr:hypothetical protein FB446DRAFT_409569 [Lentinula raphanica]
MRLRVICALLAAVLLGHVSVTASPMPPGNQQAKKTYDNTMPLYLGLLDANNPDKGWMNRVMTPKELLEHGDPFLCFGKEGGSGYFQEDSRAHSVESGFERNPNFDYFEKLTTRIKNQFRYHSRIHLRILGNAHELSKKTGMVITDRDSYYEAVACYLVENGILNKEDREPLLNEIVKTIPKLHLLPERSRPSASASNAPPPPAGNAPPPAGNAPPAGYALPAGYPHPDVYASFTGSAHLPASNAFPAGNPVSSNVPDATSTKGYFNTILDNTDPINEPMNNKSPAVNERPTSDFLSRVLNHDPPSPESNANKRPKLT